ncbi:hypothetical protein D6C77_05859 [Aureobasidium pullulans]|nr:hypothetical protein D6C77_05859 [Aureobasidium pullulans]
MQQFKLAAGLQTMYFMLLAAKAWPGTQLPEHKGNPLVHDVLDGLGLLEHKDGQDIDFGSDEHGIDTQYSSAEGVLPMEHPEHDHDAVQASPIPPVIHAEESQGSRLQLEQSSLSHFPEDESKLDRAIGPCFKSGTAVPAIPLISNTSDPFGPAAYHHSPYLVDPGQYGCDFDVV